MGDWKYKRVELPRPPHPHVYYTDKCRCKSRDCDWVNVLCPICQCPLADLDEPHLAQDSYRDTNGVYVETYCPGYDWDADDYKWGGSVLKPHISRHLASIRRRSNRRKAKK